MHRPKKHRAPLAYKVGHFIGGAQKCGTSALHEMLSGVPDLVMSDPKEAHVFDRIEGPDAHSVTRAAAQRYAKFFPPDTEGRIPVEATPIYSWHPKAPRLVHTYNPQAKWILCLRNPIARAYSQWRMRRTYYGETRDFLTCVTRSSKALSRRPFKDTNFPSDHFGLLSRGMYGQQLDRLERLFGKERVQVVLTASLRRDPSATTQVCADFIRTGVVTDPIDDHFTSETQYSAPCDDSLRILKQFYEPEIGRLTERLGMNLDHWFDHPLAD